MLKRWWSFVIRTPPHSEDCCIVHFHRSSSMVRCSATADNILSAEPFASTPQNLRTGFLRFWALRSSDAVLVRYSRTNASIVMPFRETYVLTSRATDGGIVSVNGMALLSGKFSRDAIIAYFAVQCLGSERGTRRWGTAASGSA